MPLVLPPVAIGFLLLIVFGTRAGLGAWLLKPFRHPLRVQLDGRGARIGDHHLSLSGARDPAGAGGRRQGLERGGRNAWARHGGTGSSTSRCRSPCRASWPALITAFAASLGEFGAIITFVSNIPGETRTLPLAIYTALQAPGGEAEAARLSIISILLALLFMTLAEIAARRARLAA